MNRNLKIIIITIVVFQMSCLASTAQPIKLGVSGPFSGPLDSFGISTLRAAQLVAAKLNAGGGVNGETVEVVSEDDECSPSQAAIAANNLLNAGVHVVLGHICSGATASALDIYNPANMILMSPSSTNPNLTYSGTNPLFFRTIPPDTIQAEIQTRYALNVLGFNKFALVHDGTSYGKGLVDLAKDIIEASATGAVLHYAGITPGLTMYPEPVQAIIDSGAEALIYGNSEPEAAILLNELRNQGSQIVFVSGDGVKSNDFITSTGANADGAFLSSVPDYSAEYLAQEARQEYLDQYDEEPGSFFYNAYAAASALLSAIEMADSTNYNSVKNKLQSEHFYTPIGRITFDNRGDVVGVGYSLFQIQAGSYVEIFDGSYTETQIVSVKQNERKRWDANSNNIVDIVDGIHALQIVSGIREE
jgi:branched-chain amino acid transport system substrate-binding protein